MKWAFLFRPFPKPNYIINNVTDSVIIIMSYSCITLIVHQSTNTFIFTFPTTKLKDNFQQQNKIHDSKPKG